MAGRTVLHQSVTSLPIETLRVEVLSGPDAGKQHVAEQGTISIGTAPGNDLVLSDETVSRYHLELIRDGDWIRVQDHGSTNGTAAGGVLLDRARIGGGTTLTLGRTTLRVDDGEPVAVELLEADQVGRFRGRTAESRRLMALIRRAAQTSVSVLILGETGTGKELIARSIHELSGRAGQPFETVDCGALMPTLIASELFGHERGAFTGADARHIGGFERANGGTIFLDEIGELPAAVQPALLGALERRSFRRLGGTKPIEVDIRVVSATHRDLRAEVNASTFRQDLYFRIAVLLLRVPALRERAGDLPLLIEHFLREEGYQGAVDAIVSGPTLEALKAYHWPGNVRELRNFVEVALAMGEPPRLEVPTRSEGQAAPEPRAPSLPPRTYREARDAVLHEFEARYLDALMRWADGNVSRAARHAEINRSHLTEKLKQHGIR